MRAEWTGSGPCTSGSTAHPRGATRRASGCAATTSTTTSPNIKAHRLLRLDAGRYMTDQLQHQNSAGGDETTQPAGFIAVCVVTFVAGMSATVYFCCSM